MVSLLQDSELPKRVLQNQNINWLEELEGLNILKYLFPLKKDTCTLLVQGYKLGLQVDNPHIQSFGYPHPKNISTIITVVKNG